ncbi:hypothetical protein [Acidiphilium acidophilum]|uniref:hypothetical protein n=1 Tax=Acidiphilium acidophilum TaxID=76588 RepID=UPI002E8E6C11|nr:hypothetical protein [Acidiphilium acidophilum]
MRRPRPRRGKAPLDPIVVALRHAGSIGNLEALAGIPANQSDRTRFWEPFSHLPGSAGLDAGVAELRRRIITAGVTHRTVEFLRFLRAKAQTYRDTDGMKYWDAIVRIAQAHRTDLPDPLRPHRLN